MTADPSRPAGCDYAGDEPLSIMREPGSEPRCRCLVCTRCDHHTGNNTQGH